METQPQEKTLPPGEGKMANLGAQIPESTDTRLEYAKFRKGRSKASIVTEALNNWLDQNQIPTAEALHG